MKTSHNHPLTKFVAICCLMLVTAGLYFAHEAPATGYEASIYASTPLILWISIVIALVCGVSIIVYAVYKGLEDKATWIIGALLVTLFYVIAISIYQIRGYYAWTINGDSATHVLFVKDILGTGHVPASLIYPITHINAAELVNLTNINLITLEKLMPVYFALIFILFVYVLARSVFVNKGQAILVTLVSFLFLPGTISFYPNFLANCYFPFFLFILVKIFGKYKLNWILLSLLVIFLYPVFHILPTFIAAVMLATFLLASFVYKLIDKKYKMGLYIYGLLLIVLATWSTIWITSFGIWDYTISSAYKLVTWGGTSYASSLSSQVTQAQSSGFNVLNYILKLYGVLIVFVLIAIFIFPIVWKELRTKRTDVLLLVYPSLLTIGVCTVAMYFLHLGFGPLRLLFYITLISALFVGFAFFKLLDKAKTYRSKALHYFVIGTIIVAIVILFINGLSVLYPAPYSIQQNYQTTKEEVYGMSMLLDHRNINFDIVNANLAYWRFAHLLLPEEEIKAQNIPVSVPSVYSIAAPYHFGYDNYTTFSASYPDNAYLLVTQRDYTIYTDIFPNMAKDRFTAADFSQLARDTSLYRVYMNGEFDSYYVSH